MDRDLPFSFLDHKIKCGNGLVGAWFDQFQHYPVMAWKNREAGDKNHTNGVHYEKEARTKAIKQWVKDVLTPDLRTFLQGRTLFAEDLQEAAANAHEDALAVLNRLHDLPVHDSAERARIYRTELVGSYAYQRLKAAMDLWCACWFWPADALAHAPLPSTLAEPPEPTKRLAATIASRRRFFHWELEFPDVFRKEGDGFDAMIGNPPWDTVQPSSKEFFSNIDPLYRAYGKQDALRTQVELFEQQQVEKAWLDYKTHFAEESHWTKNAANPFYEALEDQRDDLGDPAGFSRWVKAISSSNGYTSTQHPYRHQGDGKIYTYKLFLETGFHISKVGGRIGMIVPSGIYSDDGSGALRALFTEKASWEWVFSFENRERIFDIHALYKFNPLIVQKGGTTHVIRTAFMRRNIEDWTNAEMHHFTTAKRRSFPTALSRVH